MEFKAFGRGRSPTHTHNGVEFVNAYEAARRLDITLDWFYKRYTRPGLIKIYRIFNPDSRGKGARMFFRAEDVDSLKVKNG